MDDNHPLSDAVYPTVPSTNTFPPFNPIRYRVGMEQAADLRVLLHLPKGPYYSRLPPIKDGNCTKCGLLIATQGRGSLHLICASCIYEPSIYQLVEQPHTHMIKWTIPKFYAESLDTGEFADSVYIINPAIIQFLKYWDEFVGGGADTAIQWAGCPRLNAPMCDIADDDFFNDVNARITEALRRRYYDRTGQEQQLGQWIKEERLLFSQQVQLVSEGRFGEVDSAILA